MRRLRGFTLLELMTVLAIIGVLAAIAMTQYSSYMTKSRRQDGRSMILDIAQREERYFSENANYTNLIANLGYTTAAGSVIPTTTTIMSLGNNYVLSIVVTQSVSGGASDGYTISAVPVGTQLTADTTCGTLGYTSAGVRTPSTCW